MINDYLITVSHETVVATIHVKLSEDDRSRFSGHRFTEMLWPTYSLLANAGPSGFSNRPPTLIVVLKMYLIKYITKNNFHKSLISLPLYPYPKKKLAEVYYTFGPL